MNPVSAELHILQWRSGWPFPPFVARTRAAPRGGRPAGRRGDLAGRRGRRTRAARRRPRGVARPARTPRSPASSASLAIGSTAPSARSRSMPRSCAWPSTAMPPPRGRCSIKPRRARPRAVTASPSRLSRPTTQPVAWVGRSEEVPDDRLTGPASMFLLQSTQGLQLIRVQPVVDAADPGRHIGAVVAEASLARDGPHADPPTPRFLSRPALRRRRCGCSSRAPPTPDPRRSSSDRRPASRSPPSRCPMPRSRAPARGCAQQRAGSGARLARRAAAARHGSAARLAARHPEPRHGRRPDGGDRTAARGRARRLCGSRCAASIWRSRR